MSGRALRGDRRGAPFVIAVAVAGSAGLAAIATFASFSASGGVRFFVARTCVDDS